MLKVCDFGSSRWFGNGEPPRHFGARVRPTRDAEEVWRMHRPEDAKFMTGLTCTCFTAPPEHAAEHRWDLRPLGASGDSWSWCCVIARLFSRDIGSYIFMKRGSDRVLKEQLKMLKSPDSFIREYLQPDVPELLVSLIKQVFVSDPSKRPTPTEILKHPFWEGYTEEEARATVAKYARGTHCPFQATTKTLESTSTGPRLLKTVDITPIEPFLKPPVLLEKPPFDWELWWRHLVKSKFLERMTLDMDRGSGMMIFAMELAARSLSTGKLKTNHCIAGAFAIACMMLGPNTMSATKASLGEKEMRCNINEQIVAVMRSVQFAPTLACPFASECIRAQHTMRTPEIRSRMKQVMENSFRLPWRNVFRTKG